MVIAVIVDPLDPRSVADALHAGATGVLSDGVSADDAASLVQIAARGTAVVDGRAAGSLASAWLPGSARSAVGPRVRGAPTPCVRRHERRHRVGALLVARDREVARGTAAPQDRSTRPRCGSRQGAPSRPPRRRRPRRARRRLTPARRSRPPDRLVRCWCPWSRPAETDPAVVADAGLTAAEVAERVASGAVNDVPDAPSRTTSARSSGPTCSPASTP